MTISKEKPAQHTSRFPLFRRAQPWRELFGYSVGDVHDDGPVAVAAGATVVGNIYAPQIMVAGLLYGLAVGREITVQSQGQIWGDVSAVRFHVEPGGIVRGWMNTLAEAEYAELANGRFPTPITLPTDSPDGLKSEHFRLPDHDKLDTLHRLQAATAVALAARAELEETFDDRLAEIAGDNTNQLALLRDELRALRAELATAQQDHKETTATLQLRETQLERQGKELALAQETLARTNQELEELRETHVQKEAAFRELTSAKAGVDTHLHEALVQVDTLSGRVHNIETALQASLVHSSDQEDALLRWQELAESTEMRVKELERELTNTQAQLDQGRDRISLLLDQRKQVEQEWTQSQVRLENLQKQLKDETETGQKLLAESDATINSLIGLNNELKAQVEPLQERNATLTKQMQMAKAKFFKQEEEISLLRQQYAELETRWNQTDAELEKVRQQPTKLLTSQQLDELKSQLQTAEEAIENYQEQVLWYQANLETTQSALKQARQTVAQQAAQVASLEAAQAALQTQHATQRAELEQLQHQFQDEQARTQGETVKLKDELRQVKIQLTSNEADLRRHQTETASQGQRLAEIQAILIERELELADARQTAVKQQQLIKQIKQVTSQKISNLEAALARAQKTGAA